MKLELGKKYNIREPGYRNVQYALITEKESGGTHPYWVNYFDQKGMVVDVETIRTDGLVYTEDSNDPLDLVSEYNPIKEYNP